MNTQQVKTKNTTLRILQHSDPNSDAVGLNKYGMSKLPGTMHLVQPAQDADGRWITGIDELASDLNNLSKEEREKQSKKRLALRLALQTQLGISDLSATSNYWDNYMIDLGSLNILDIRIPKHILILKVLRANKHIMPDSTFSGTPEYWDTKFVSHNPDFESGLNNDAREIVDTSIVNAINCKKDFDKLYMVTRLIIGDGISKEMGPVVIYDKLRKFMDLKPVDNGKLLNKYYEKDMNELANLVVIRDAFRLSVIVFRNNQYSRGNIVFGRSEDDVLETLAMPDMYSELDSIRNEVETKLKNSKS